MGQAFITNEMPLVVIWKLASRQKNLPTGKITNRLEIVTALCGGLGEKNNPQREWYFRRCGLVGRRASLWKRAIRIPLLMLPLV